MIKFIFFGRITQEKWINQIMEVFSRLYKEWITNWHIDIYWDWPLLHQCKIWSHSLPLNTHIHGRSNQQTIIQSLRTMHYALMPSVVIESFGMSALESLIAGVTVIWTKLWGLEQFIEEEYDTNIYDIYTIIKKVIMDFSQEKRRKESKIAHEKAGIYSQQKRLEKVKNIGDIKEVFLVSDYITRIGWIESMLFNMKRLLEENWSRVFMYWWKLRKNKRVWLWRKIGLFSTSYNWSNHIALRIWIQKYKPTLIRLHSVNRYLWWFPITALLKSPKTQILCSIHDLGMFHPFGADVWSIKDIPEFSLTGFTSVTKNPLKKILIWFKFISLLLLKKQLIKKVDIWIVPSNFMIDIVHQKRQIPLRKIIVLPHFI